MVKILVFVEDLVGVSKLSLKASASLLVFFKRGFVQIGQLELLKK